MPSVLMNYDRPRQERWETAEKLTPFKATYRINQAKCNENKKQTHKKRIHFDEMRLSNKS